MAFFSQQLWGWVAVAHFRRRKGDPGRFSHLPKDISEFQVELWVKLGPRREQ